METMNTFPSWFRSPPQRRWSEKQKSFPNSSHSKGFNSPEVMHSIHFHHHFPSLSATSFVIQLDLFPAWGFQMPSRGFCSWYSTHLITSYIAYLHHFSVKPTCWFRGAVRACMCATLKSFRVVVNETPSVLTPWVAINSSFFYFRFSRIKHEFLFDFPPEKRRPSARLPT